VGKDIGELHARAGFRHHRGDGVAPELVMGGFLVRGGRGGSAIGFDEHEARWIVLLLDNVEPGDAGFAERLPGVFQARGREGLGAAGFYVNQDMNDEHRLAGWRYAITPTPGSVQAELSHRGRRRRKRSDRWKSGTQEVRYWMAVSQARVEDRRVAVPPS